MGDTWIPQQRGYGVSLKRPFGTTKEGGMALVRETCEYHSRLKGYGVSLGEACVNCLKPFKP